MARNCSRGILGFAKQKNRGTAAPHWLKPSAISADRLLPEFGDPRRAAGFSLNAARPPDLQWQPGRHEGVNKDYYPDKRAPNYRVRLSGLVMKIETREKWPVKEPPRQWLGKRGGFAKRPVRSKCSSRGAGNKDNRRSEALTRRLQRCPRKV